MRISQERFGLVSDPFAEKKPEELEKHWFDTADSAIFVIRRSSFPPPPMSQTPTPAPIGDNLADDWFR